MSSHKLCVNTLRWCNMQSALIKQKGIRFQNINKYLSPLLQLDKHSSLIHLFCITSLLKHLFLNLQVRHYLMKYAWFAYISKAGIWTLNKNRFKILIHFDIYNTSVILETFFLLIHKSENTLQSQKKMPPCFLKKKFYELYEQSPL